MNDSTDPSEAKRRAGWMPMEQDDLEAWLQGHREQVEAGGDAPLHPSVAALGELIDSDPLLRMYAERMIAEVPSGKDYSQRHLEDPQQMLRLINAVLHVAPEFGESAVTTPLGGILDWTMGSSAGFAFYRDPRVNDALRGILNAWAEHLNSPDSLDVLNDSPSGWMSDAAAEAIGIEQYEYDPDDRHWGFTSWNDFFTRRFRKDVRPVAAPDDDGVIVSPCESTPFAIATDVQLHDRFWLKGQPYSLHDMLARDPAAESFSGGTVYQAFLSATDYHRWHSPVAGTIVRAFLQPGTYYSEADSEGAEAAEPTYSQGYLAHVAARAIVLIEADNPAIGLMALVPVGMSDVSSCLIGDGIEAGRHVDKGEELGRFQFGGSSQCLVFRKDVIADFSLGALPRSQAPLVLVNSKIATARTSG